MGITHTRTQPSNFEVWYESFASDGRALSFPCDAEGRVDIDALSERCRNNYFLVRAMLGRDYASPRIVPRGWPIPPANPCEGAQINRLPTDARMPAPSPPLAMEATNDLVPSPRVPHASSTYPSIPQGDFHDLDHSRLSGSAIRLRDHDVHRGALTPGGDRSRDHLLRP